MSALITSKEALNLLTPTAFKEWLAGLQDDFVGYEDSSYHCPITRFFEAHNIEVKAGFVFAVKNSSAVPMPKLWQEVIYRIDNGQASRECHENKFGRIISRRPVASEVIRVLEEAEKECR